MGKSHAIVGSGITALAFLETCLGRKLRDVTVIGAHASQFGRGVAYAKGEEGTPWRYAYLLNSPADDIDPEFAGWLKANWHAVSKTMEGRKPDWLGAAAPLLASGDLFGVNAPREFYGDFMEERAQKVKSELATEGTTVTFLEDVATEISLTDDRIILRTQSAQELTFGSADLAPGGPSTMRFDGDDGPFSAPSVFGHEQRISEHIRQGAEIFCIGGNAAMLDVLRLCQSQIPRQEIKFAFCSPEGEIPPALVPRLPRKMTKPTLSRGHAEAESFLSEIQSEIGKAEASGDQRREIRAGVRAFFLENPLQNFVPDPQEAAKVARTLRFWLRGGTRDTIFDMHKLVDTGNVHILKGHVTKIETKTAGATVHMVAEDGSPFSKDTGFVVNCAGAGPTSRFDTLTEDMIAQGLIDVVHGGGLATGQGCQLGSTSLRYLSPAVTKIGDETVAMPLYDAHMLRTYVSRSV